VYLQGIDAMISPRSQLVGELATHSWPRLFALYLELAGHDPKAASFMATAIMHKARHDSRPDEVLPTLMMFTAQAHDVTALTFLAKALAAYGRAAHEATSLVLKRLRSLPVTDDASFWAVDSLWHVVGFIGVGPEPLAAVEAALLANPKQRVAAIGQLYDGTLSESARVQMYWATLTRVREFLTTPALEPWRATRTQGPRAQAEPAVSKPACSSRRATELLARTRKRPSRG